MIKPIANAHWYCISEHFNWFCLYPMEGKIEMNLIIAISLVLSQIIAIIIAMN
jgi:hypothetical protein